MGKIFIGNIRGPKGNKGDRGSNWKEGTAITGTSTTDTAFPNSGITDAMVDDQYLNTDTGNLYTCTVAGDPNTAMWVYTGNIKGPKGDVEDGVIDFSESDDRENIVSGDTVSTVFGKIKKWFSDLGAAAFMNVVNGVTQSQAGQAVLDAAVGKYLEEKKLDITKIIANRNITEPGFVMDGKTLVNWLNELNGKFSVRSRTVVHGTTVEEINTILDNFYNELNNYTISSKAINIGVNDAVLRGGYWDIITSRTNEKYGYQIAMSYYSEFKFRILLSGTWHNWDRFALTSDNIVNTTGTIYISANTAKDFLYSVIQNVRSLFPDVIEKDGGTLIVNTVWADHGYFNGIVTKHGANNILLNLHFNDGRSYTMLYNVTTGNIVYSRISPDTISL